MINITLTYNLKDYKIDLDSDETVFTLTIAISDLLQLPMEGFYLKLNERGLVNFSTKISELEDQLKNLKLEVVKINKVKEKKKITQNGEEDFLTAMMKNPGVRNMMKDKDLMKNLIKSNPKLKEKYENSPELRSYISDEFIESELEKISEDPKYLKEQMHNTDLQMRQLENIPGGLDMVNDMMDRITNDFKFSMTDGSQNSFNLITKTTGSDKDMHKVVSTPIVNAKASTSDDDSIVSKDNYLIKYSNQLRILNREGFVNFFMNIDALKISEGNLEKALEILTESGVEKK